MSNSIEHLALRRARVTNKSLRDILGDIEVMRLLNRIAPVEMQSHIEMLTRLYNVLKNEEFIYF